MARLNPKIDEQMAHTLQQINPALFEEVKERFDAGATVRSIGMFAEKLDNATIETTRLCEATARHFFSELP